MKRYAIVIEDAGTNLAAYVPDLPGCIATGRIEEEVEQLIREAIELHLEGMAEDGLTIPEPSSQVEYVDVPTTGGALPNGNGAPPRGEMAFAAINTGARAPPARRGCYIPS